MKTSDMEIDGIKGKLEEAVHGDRAAFLPSFLAAYGIPKTTIRRMEQAGPDPDGRISIRQKLLFVAGGGTSADVERNYLDAIEAATHKERFVIATDFARFMSKDMASDRGIDISFDELPDNYEFFLPWCGREIVEQMVENPADVKAATQMGHLFEAIKKDNINNPEMTETAFNVFLTRLLFCFFADDTHIFKKGQFRNAIQLHTADDGSTVASFLEGLFDALDRKPEERDGVKDYYLPFPYVNGGLFRNRLPIPRFSKASRRKLLECGASDWSAINPDIFGSMFQTVISEEQRRTLGQHYTSVTNIMKVLNPLFLDGLRAELADLANLPYGEARKKKLQRFRDKIAAIKVFDPACGSGNFLITAYKELCHLDMEAIRLLDELPFVGIHLDNFYGIEIDDFPCEIARLSLWLAQHQINMECLEIYGNANPTLPLTETGHIVCGNALRLDWNEVCPADSTVIIASNPPYSGRNLLDDMQVAELTEIMKDATNVGYLDYVWCWIKLSAQYINSNRSTHCLAGMVATNSIGQGIQAPAWLAVSHRNCDIFFAYESFKWANNAKDKAGVTVTIVGIKAKEDDRPKHIYGEDNVRLVSNINPYLIDASDAIVTVKEDNTTGYRMNFGTMYRDGGNLIMSTAEKKELLKSYPAAEPYIHRFIGSEEFINGKERWCLWITDDDYPEADRIPPIHERIEAVRAFRLASKASSTRKFGETPWKAAQIAYVSDVPMITIPRVSSERREYIPIGYLAENTVVSDSAYVIYNGPYWLFSVLTSRMHMAWVRTVAGRLKTDYRYSNTLCYNTFPFPTLSDGQKKALEESAMRILEARENHYENTMAQLYDPGKMPDDLRAAHESNDLLVDSLYRKSGFDNDSERLQELFRRYKEATGGK
jgi:hypothetical protein